jgi:hypothetical protein
MNFYGGTFFAGGFFGALVAGGSGGAGKKRRRWQAERDGKVYEFASAREAQQFLQSVVHTELKQNRKKQFRLPDIEIFYDDIQVTNLVVEDKPVIEWFFSDVPIRALELAMAAWDEDDIEVLILGL